MHTLVEKAFRHMSRLCRDKSGRSVGSPANRAAADYVAGCAQAAGFVTETQEFDCMHWQNDGSVLQCGNVDFSSSVSPYSIGCNISAPLYVVSTVAELAAAHCEGMIVLLRGEIASEPLMPKAFPFYNPDAHKKIIDLLETKGCLAVIAATGRNPAMAGGACPYPLITDGDFDIPSVYVTEVIGESLACAVGKTVRLDVNASRLSATGWNVVAKKLSMVGKRIVIVAHLDTWWDTPGAIDNAGGVVVLLLLMELLSGCREVDVEIVALNGEDYYSNPGQVLYLDRNRDRFADVLVGINIDGVGYGWGDTAYSLYGCSQEMARVVDRSLSSEKGFVAGEQWYQGDHGLFIAKEVPAIAITSERMSDVLTVAHTQDDTVDVVDCEQLVRVAEGLRDLVVGLAGSS